MKGYIFDLDGTLTNTLNAIAHFGNSALEAYGMEAIETERYKEFVGDGRDVLIHRMLSVYDNDTQEMFEKVREVYDAGYEADYLYETDAYDGIRELLNELKAKGKKLAICSNKPDNVARFVVDTIFGADFFDAVTGQKPEVKTKPSPDMAINTAKEMGLSPDECFFIGDTNVDIFTGKNAGIKTIGVLWGFRGIDELKDAGADYIVSKPAQIAEL